jgi:hypothetical protein
MSISSRTSAGVAAAAEVGLGGRGDVAGEGLGVFGISPEAGVAVDMGEAGATGVDEGVAGVDGEVSGVDGPADVPDGESGVVDGAIGVDEGASGMAGVDEGAAGVAGVAGVDEGTSAGNSVGTSVPVDVRQGYFLDQGPVSLRLRSFFTQYISYHVKS